MNSPIQDAYAPHPAPGRGEAEETLRLIANLPAPKGLEDRVKARLQAAARTNHVLPWPADRRPGAGWMHSKVMRGAAAAAIVVVVAGGGWGVYSRVQPAQTPNAIVMPRVAAPGGFSGAGAIRSPQTLKGPVLTHRVPATPKQAVPHAKASRNDVQKPKQKGKATAIPASGRKEAAPVE